MQQIQSHAALCQLWRRADDLAADINAAMPHNVRPITRECVRKWKCRNSVPPQYWRVLIDLAERRHAVMITYRQLTELTEHRLRTKERAEAA
jgi:hypothetical protein